MANAKAAPKPKAAKGVPTEVVVTYDLFDLPTAYHKAGLAGLVLVIDSLKARKLLTDESAKYTMTPTCVTVTFTEPMVQALMDDVYDAELAVRKDKKADSKAKAKSGTDDGKEAKEPPPVPKLKAIDEMLPEGNPLWIKLWREMIFQGPRNQPTTWLPYKDRAAGRSYRKPKRDPWADLLVHEKKKAKGLVATATISGSLMLGIQDTNPEQVPCEGRVDQTFLLHFWPLAVLVYAPQAIDREGNSAAAGYTLAIPEVANLEAFITEYRRMLHGLDDGLSVEQAKRGFRPTRAVIDLAAESALSFLANLAAITTEKIADSALVYSVNSVEYLHIFKQKRNVKTMAAGRVSPNPKLLAGYREIVTPKLGVQPLFRNPLFRRGLLLALLDGTEWYRPFGKVMATYDIDLFLRQPRKSTEADQKAPPQFAADAATKLRYVTKLFADSVKRFQEMPEAERPKAVAPLPVIVNRVVRNYLLARSSEKSGVKLDAFENDDKIDWAKVPAEYNEAKQKLAMGLMYEFRSRRDQAFVEHFATTFFSVTQRINEADRLVLADALLLDEQRDALKTLTLLSLSANS